jgi:ABC-2 type transport system permease protein
VNPLPPAVRALLRKELWQMRHSRGAMLSAILLPIFLMVVSPIGQLLALRASSPQQEPEMLPGLVPPGMAEFGEPTRLFTHFLLPLFVALSGLLIPSMAATYTVVAERERRTIELLMALPVRVADILIAKLLAMLTTALAVVLPLFLVDVVALVIMQLATPLYLALLLAVLISALLCSIGLSLLLALLARDLRTANNLNGALIGPLMLAILAILAGVPGDLRLLVLAAVFLAVGALAVLAGLRWLTFERYLA